MITTTAQMSTYVLEGLNKTAASSVTPAEFEVIINGALMEFVQKRYRAFDTDQQARDDLRVLVPAPLTIPNTGGTSAGQELFQLPYVQSPSIGESHGYMHLLNVGLALVDEQGDPIPCSISDGFVVARPLHLDGSYTADRNPFWRPTNREPYYILSGHAFRVRTGGAIASQARIEYLRYPSRLTLSGGEPELPAHANQEICDIAIRKGLERIRDPRWQSFIQEQQLK